MVSSPSAASKRKLDRIGMVVLRSTTPWVAVSSLSRSDLLTTISIAVPCSVAVSGICLPYLHFMTSTPGDPQYCFVLISNIKENYTTQRQQPEQWAARTRRELVTNQGINRERSHVVKPGQETLVLCERVCDRFRQQAQACGNVGARDLSYIHSVQSPDGRTSPSELPQQFSRSVAC